MMSLKRSLRDLRISTGCLILLAAFAAAAGCTTANNPDGQAANHLTPSGKSVAGWVVPTGGSLHAKSASKEYASKGSLGSCTGCHGGDLTGGISKVSCFDPASASSCHHGTIAGWDTPQQHGATAKRAPGSSSFFSCQICHGKDFLTVRDGKTCFTCHQYTKNPAPHAGAPWLSFTSYTHTDTDTSNAPVCKQCHYPGSPNNPAGHPATPAPAGTAPGCYNNTLCHSVGVPHALGTIWTDPTTSQFHGLTAKQNLSYCQGCHGTPGTTLFNGGYAPTSCQASCHTQAKAHPIRWYQAPQPFPGYVSSHRDSGNRSVACAICHKVDGAGTGPDPTAPSCFSATFNGVNCHSGGPGAANHPVPFQGTTHTQANQAGYDADCANCHSITGVPPNSSAPLCTACHQAGSPLTNGSCTSCHARPPAGATYPNVAGRHAKHDALAGVTGVCSACHNGLDSGSLAHYNRANARPGKNALRVAPGDAAFLATYNAKAGAASFDNVALTCANVSCHGAVTAPNWQTGTIAVNTDAGCRQCHKIGTAAQTPENNSPYSGLHTFHLSTSKGGAILCTECHNMANGTTGALNHYKFLNTAPMEGPAKDTLEPNGLAANYNAANQTCGTFTCHGETHTNFSWSGGANHPVPPDRFTGTNHTSVASGTFPTSCGGCHYETGALTKIGPTCTVCHQAGSPLTATNCTSCHGGVPTKGPNGPTTTAPYPNKAGAHGKHWDLGPLGNAISCDTCHSGLGSGTTAHYDRANARTGTLRVQPGDVVFLTTYNAKTGASSFNSSMSALSCSNVRCHGGQATPNWQTGTLTVNDQCTSCHESGDAQYNSFASGKHGDHSGAGCTDCHNMANGTTGANNHFRFLDTSTMEGPARDTFQNPTVTYSGGNCTGTCHIGGDDKNHQGEGW